MGRTRDVMGVSECVRTPGPVPRSAFFPGRSAKLGVARAGRASEQTRIGADRNEGAAQRQIAPSQGIVRHQCSGSLAAGDDGANGVFYHLLDLGMVTIAGHLRSASLGGMSFWQSLH
jgi:hypothetical protein